MIMSKENLRAQGREWHLTGKFDLLLKIANGRKHYKILVFVHLSDENLFGCLEYLILFLKLNLYVKAKPERGVIILAVSTV